MSILVQPTQEQLETILNDISLNPIQLEKDIITLREWLNAQPHLPNDIDDGMLSSFIVGCKNSIERAKQTLDAYFTNRTAIPEFYDDRDPCSKEFRKSAKVVRFFTLPGMTAEGYRVNIYSIRNPDPDEYCMKSSTKRLLAIVDVRLKEDSFWGGDYLVLDCKDIRLGHLKKMTPTLIKKYLYCCQDTIAARIKGIILFNMSQYMEPLLAIAKPFLKEKIAKRIYTHTEDHTILYQYMHKDMLPTEYGGRAGSLDSLNDSWQKHIESHRDWFLKDRFRKVDESKRPEKYIYKPKKLFGIEGTFKQLAID